MDEDERDDVVVRGETTARDDMGWLPEKPSTRTAEQQHVTARTATLVARKDAMVSALLTVYSFLCCGFVDNDDTLDLILWYLLLLTILFWFLCERCESVGVCPLKDRESSTV